LNPDPFPAILCGLISGAIVTLLNHYAKKPLNNPEVIDTHGTLYTFFVAALIGGIYSAILSAVYPYPTDIPTSVNTWTNSGPNQWLPFARSKIGQGAMQIASHILVDRNRASFIDRCCIHTLFHNGVKYRVNF
jgi:hypothetical protein